MSKLKLDPGAHQIFLMLYTTAVLGWQKCQALLVTGELGEGGKMWNSL